jgi:hypothetical protein
VNKPPLTISGPYTHENLTIFLFHGPDRFDGSCFTSLARAFAEKYVRVYETGTVGRLEVENLADKIDIFIQAGDVLKGGRQDRTLAIDFIVPARSGRIPVPAFCVESGRWHKRGTEDEMQFSGSTHSIHAKSMRLAAKRAFNQNAVWHSVAESQEALGVALKKSVHVAHSPTSYQLSVEDPHLEKRKREYQKKLLHLPDNASDVLGYAFYINGRRNSVDTYGSTELFRQLWDKLLDVAILEAVAAQNQKRAIPKKRSVLAWLNEASQSQPRDRKHAAPRTRFETKSYQSGVVFDTVDEAIGNDDVLHTNIISR